MATNYYGLGRVAARNEILHKVIERGAQETAPEAANEVCGPKYLLDHGCSFLPEGIQKHPGYVGPASLVSAHFKAKTPHLHIIRNSA
jgi:hypothetical protein